MFSEALIHVPGPSLIIQGFQSGTGVTAFSLDCHLGDAVEQHSGRTAVTGDKSTVSIRCEDLLKR